MLMPRVIPCLLLKDGGLVKTIRFKDASYVGDPINVIRIYNEKEVDELLFLDITATSENQSPPYKVLAEIASECFMPVTYGGGIRDLETIRKVLSLGVEKVAINSAAVENPNLVREAAETFGSSTIVASIDVRRSALGHDEVFIRGGRCATGLDPVRLSVTMAEYGAGEILLTAVERDGTREGYDLELIRQVTGAVDVPVIAAGGAGKIEDLRAAVKDAGASACAVGSMVVYVGRNRAVLVTFPPRQKLAEIFG